MKIKSFGFSRITTEELKVLVNSDFYAFDCTNTPGLYCKNCPFWCKGQSCPDIDSTMGRLARAELNRRLWDEKK